MALHQGLPPRPELDVLHLWRVAPDVLTDALAASGRVQEVEILALAPVFGGLGRALLL